MSPHGVPQTFMVPAVGLTIDGSMPRAGRRNQSSCSGGDAVIVGKQSAQALPPLDYARLSAAVVRWIDETDESILFLSALTLGEIRNGIERLRPGKRRGRLESWLRVDLRSRFEGRILPVDDAVVERWGAMSAIATASGRPVPVIDGLLAATALHHDLMLVTRNVQDVAGTAVPALNPWS
jgi:predicted nucleic acid-binding protein